MGPVSRRHCRRPAAAGRPGKARARTIGEAEARVLAVSAFDAALAGREPAAAAAILELDAADPGGRLLVGAMCRWADTLTMLQQGGPLPAGQPVRPVWVDPGTGDVTTDAAQVDELNRWTGRFLAARAQMDHGTCLALVASVPNGLIRRYAAAVLAIAVGTARMTRSQAPEPEQRRATGTGQPAGPLTPD